MAGSCVSGMQSGLKLTFNLSLKTVNSCSDDVYANMLPYTHPLKTELNKCSRLTIQEINN